MRRKAAASEPAAVKCSTAAPETTAVKSAAVEPATTATKAAASATAETTATAAMTAADFSGQILGCKFRRRRRAGTGKRERLGTMR